jgi:DNA-binding winged helix-turn-helix (wHTH) protein
MSQGIKENPQTDEVISFGPFRLYAAQRLIEREGVPLHLGGRALDILLVLVEHAGKVVSKNDLMARVWPGVTVDEVASGSMSPRFARHWGMESPEPAI